MVKVVKKKPRYKRVHWEEAHKHHVALEEIHNSFVTENMTKSQMRKARANIHNGVREYTLEHKLLWYKESFWKEIEDPKDAEILDEIKSNDVL